MAPLRSFVGALLFSKVAVGLKVEEIPDEDVADDLIKRPMANDDSSMETLIEYLAPPIGAPLSYRHMARMGANDLRGLFPTFLASPAKRTTTFKLGREDARMDNDTNVFTVGVVRNPCNWYVDAWASQWNHMLPNNANLPPLTPDRDTPEDIFNFKDAVNRSVKTRIDATGRNAPGIEASLMAYVYVRTDAYPKAKIRPQGKEELDASRAAIEAFDPSSIDCWLKTESLATDVGVCLMKYEETTENYVNWKAYESWVNRFKSARANEASGLACKDFYDEATASLVLEAEATIFKKFGYTSCCAK